MSVNRKITQGILGGSFLTVVSIAIALLQYRYIFQFLPAQMAGVWFLFLTFSAYATFFDLGLGPTLAREMGFILGNVDWDVQQKETEIAHLQATCARIYYFLAALVLVIALVAGTIYLRSVTPLQNQHEVQFAWSIFAFGAALNILAAMSFAEMYGRGNIATERLTRALTQIIGFVFAVGFLKAGFGLVGLASAWVIQCVLARSASVIKLGNWKNHAGRIGRYRAAIARRVAGPSLRWAGTALGGVLILQTDNVIIASVLGPGLIAIYEPLSKIVGTLMTFSMLIVTSSTPFLSQSFAANNRTGFTEQVYRNVRFSMSAMIVLASFLCFYGDRIIAVWLGPQAFAGFPIIWVFSVMILLECHHVNLATAVMATGRRFFFFVALLAGVLNLVVSWNLAKAYGLIGVAAGTMIAQVLTNNWYVPYVSLKILEIPFAEYSRRIIVPLGGLLAVALLTNGVFSAQLRSASDHVAIIAGFAVSLLVCAGWFGAFILTKGELSVLSRRVMKKTGTNDRTDSP